MSAETKVYEDKMDGVIRHLTKEPEPYRRGLSPFRKPAGRSNQSGDRMRQITATAPTIDIPII